MARPDILKPRSGATVPDRKRSSEEASLHGSSILAHDEIAERAYEIFLARGSEEGHAIDDWLEAERMLMRQAVKRRRAGQEPH